MMKKNKSYRYPWRYNNTFKVLVDGTEFFPLMLQEIKKAEKNILFEAYLFESGNTADMFIEELIQAKNRGVNTYVLLDEYGSKGLNDDDKDKMTSAGIELLLYNPVSLLHFGRSLKRDHRKLLTIDDRIAFIGGAGITDEFSPGADNRFWHDVMLKVTGNIVPDLSHSFKCLWDKESHVQIVADNHKENKNHHDKARVLIAAGVDKNEIARSIISRIRSSKEKIWLMSPYFISSWKIRRALRAAAKRGVDVRLIFPGPHSDHKWVSYGIQRYYYRLLKSNIAVYEYQPRFNHAKIILCDNWFTIGSSNLDRWNQYLNLDANIEIYNKKILQQIINLFKTDFSNSNLIILNQWTTRSLAQQFKEWISGIVISWLSFISRKFKR